MKHDAGAQPVRYHKIKSLEIVGGFLDGARFDFSDHLNCLIGGRGTGKTTVLEFVRYALDAFPSEDDSRSLCRDIENLVRSNLGGGRIQLTIETKDGLVYVINRTVGEEPRVMTKDGQPTDISLGHGAFFSADVYSQNQIECISNNPRFQLVLIDSFVEEKIAEIQSRLGKIYREMDANAEEIFRIEQEIGELEEGLGELPTVEANLAAFAQAHGEDAKRINEQHELKARRDREKRALESMNSVLSHLRQSLFGNFGQINSRTRTFLPDDLLSGPNAEILNSIRKKILARAARADDHVVEAIAEIDTSLQELLHCSQSLSISHQEQEQVFRKVIEAHAQAQAQVAERSRLERLKNDLLGRRHVCDERKAKLKILQEQRDGMMREVSELRDQRFALRCKVAADLTTKLHPTIRVTVEQFGNSQEYEDLLADGLKHSGLQSKRAAARIAAAMSPADLARAVRQDDIQTIMDLVNVTSDQATKIISALARTKRVFDIETVELLDLPRIELLDGETYKDSTTLSTGQKCTTILPILLLESESPLLIDQPEDNLDNRFIYDTVVKNVADIKSKRQLLFVTHNPNIPVLGDSEKVFVMASSGTKGMLKRSGAVDACRDDIETILEGGREAFKRRMEKYGH